MDTSTAGSHAVEELIAELQQARAGLRPWEAERLHAQVSALNEEAGRLGLGGFLAELLADSDVPDVSSAFIDLEADEPGRRLSHARWREAARQRLPDLWDWVRRRVEGGAWTTWWCQGVGLMPPEETVELLATVTAPLRPLRPIAEKWGAQAALEEGTAEHNWRWLALGRGLSVPVPAFPELLSALVHRFRQLRLLPTHHRVQLIRRPNTPSMVLPIRVPGHSVLSVPSAVSPLTVQYLQHELAHLAEHALRPPEAGLLERWRFDPVRSEGWALFFERLLQAPRWLEELGFSPEQAQLLAGFFRDEEAFSQGLIAADLAMDQRLPELGSAQEAVRYAQALAEQLGIAWAPEIMLFRLPRMMHWRSYIAGWAWRDAAWETLARRFGHDWMYEPGAWAAVSGALGNVGSAAGALRELAFDAGGESNGAARTSV